MGSKKGSMKYKIAISIAVVSFICFAVMGIIGYRKTADMMVEQIKDDAIAMAVIAAGEIDGQLFTTIESEEDDAFKTVLGQISKYRDGGNIEYIYTMKKEASGDIVFVVDADEEDPAACLELYEDDLEDAQPAFSGTACADQEVSEDDWGRFISAYAPVKDGNATVGIVGIDVSIESVQEKLASLKKLFVLLTLVFAFACVVVTVFISSKICSNLNKLHAKVKELNSGDGDLTKRVDIKSKDELELIAEQFNLFIENIRSLVAKVAKTSNNVSSDTADMNASVTGCKDNISAISEALHNLSASMEESSASLSLILDQMNGQTNVIEQLCQSSSGSSSRAVEISSAVVNEQAQMQKKTENATRLVDELKNTLAATVEKCKDVYEIEALADQILKVSSTTQILSLNANIEAARAGVAGRGFAIIAGDIEKLSKEIQLLAGQISSTNAVVISSVEELVENVSKTSEFISGEVLSDYKGFEKMGNEYSGNMQLMSKVLSDITDNLNEISINVSDLMTSVKNIDFVINDSTVKVVEVAENSSELSEHMEELATMSSSIKDEMVSITSDISGFVY